MASAAPRLVIVAGVNGAGKSTIAADKSASDLLIGARAINPDEHTKALRLEFGLSQKAANLLGVFATESEAWRAVAEGDRVELGEVHPSGGCRQAEALHPSR